MASVINDPNGRRRIQFESPEGGRRTIRLGKVSERNAESFKFRVEQLLAAKLLGSPLDAETARWVADLDSGIAKKLARVGLIPDREPRREQTVGPFIEAYVARRVDVSPHTRRIWRQTARLLAEYFGADRPLSTITRGEASEWRLSLVGKGMADASVRKHCGFAKHFFAQAVDRELITTNPFGKLVSAPVGNEARKRFVSRGDIQKVLDACPDAQWRLIVALSRYGGLRCPSEHLALTWDDIDFVNNRIVVHSPKTAKHEGRASRVIPLFPELRPYLEDARELSDGKSPFVVTRYRDGNANLRTTFEKIVRRAGLAPWPKIFHNLRASRATELAAEHPAHIAAAWLGHSTVVAQKHYWQVTDADFERAITGPEKSDAKCGALEAQKAAQRVRAGNRDESQDSSSTSDHERDYTLCGASSRNAAKEMAEVHGNRTHQPHDCHAVQRF